MDKDKIIAQLNAEIERLKELVSKDELTNLYNRRGFKEEIEPFVHEVLDFKKQPDRRKSFFIKNFGLIVFDVDDFKKINDTYGHDVGDKALKLLSSLIKDRVREIDLVARWGGEEIIAGLPGANIDDSYKVAEDIIRILNESSGEPKFTVSAGVSDISQADGFEELFKNADLALYKAKSAGKNRAIKFEKE